VLRPPASAESGSLAARAPSNRGGGFADYDDEEVDYGDADRAWSEGSELPEREVYAPNAPPRGRSRGAYR
jgi:hypothetical protein